MIGKRKQVTASAEIGLIPASFICPDSLVRDISKTVLTSKRQSNTLLGSFRSVEVPIALVYIFQEVALPHHTAIVNSTNGRQAVKKKKSPF